MNRFVLFLFCGLVLQTVSLASSIDFSNYRPGGNNRPLFEAIVKELATEFGHPVATAYGKDLQAKVDRIVIDEDQMDKYVGEVQEPREREAIARFILAHEYFHVILKHPQTSDWRRSPREIEIMGKYNEARKYMEQQVDHLAGKYIHKLGLSTEPIQKMFFKHPELHGGGEYPSAQERVEIVERSKNPGIEEEHFDNRIIRCTFLLARLAKKLH